MNAAGKAPKRRRQMKSTVANVMSRRELAALGGGHIAYVRKMTSDQAKEMFPAIDNLPNDIHLFALHAADGTPIALTDTRQAAIGHAIEDELEVRSLH